MAITNGYCDLGEFRDWAQVPGLDKTARIEDCVTATSRAIDLYSDRHFWKTDVEVRTFEACTSRRVDLDDLVLLVAVKTDASGDGTFETTWAPSDYQALPSRPKLGWPYTSIGAVAGRTFPAPTWSGRRDRVQVTGVWGWDAVPVDVKQACLIKSAKLFARHQSPHGIAGTGDFGPIRISRFEDPDVSALLDPYRRIAVLVA